MPAHAVIATKKKPRKARLLLRFFLISIPAFGRVNDDRGFNLDRACTGYQYDLSKELQLKVVADFGQSKVLMIISVYQVLKMPRYHGNVKSGHYTVLISTTQLKFQEASQAVCDESFQDEYKFGKQCRSCCIGSLRFQRLCIGRRYSCQWRRLTKNFRCAVYLQYGAGVTLMPVKNLYPSLMVLIMKLRKNRVKV